MEASERKKLPEGYHDAETAMIDALAELYGLKLDVGHFETPEDTGLFESPDVPDREWKAWVPTEEGGIAILHARDSAERAAVALRELQWGTGGVPDAWKPAINRASSVTAVVLVALDAIWSWDSQPPRRFTEGDIAYMCYQLVTDSYHDLRAAYHADDSSQEADHADD